MIIGSLLNSWEVVRRTTIATSLKSKRDSILEFRKIPSHTKRYVYNQVTFNHFFEEVIAISEPKIKLSIPV